MTGTQKVFKADSWSWGGPSYVLWRPPPWLEDPSPAHFLMGVRHSPHLAPRNPAVSLVSLFSPTGGSLGQDLRAHRRNKL